jgi:hypothetical protein
MDPIDINDIAGRFDMSATEAARIAKTVDTENEFISVWEGEDWWADANYA